MQERTEYLPGVPCWVDTEQPDPQAATAFYGGLFGWEFDDRIPAGAEGHYYVATRRGLDVAGITCPAEPGERPAAWNTYVAVESADAAAGTVKDAGGTVVMAPFDVPDVGRMGVFADPSGAVFCVWQPRGHQGAQLVNELGTWVFSDLNTRDPQAAEAFYRAVFGWETKTLDLGDRGFTFWRLPGYGEFLAARDPELRRRLDEAEAPPGMEDVPVGFADAVATLVHMTDEQFPPDVPSHWGITFAVDDADAATARAEELGATVLVPPFDAPPVRMAVLRDPQGAVLTVSKYQPDA